LRNSKPPNKPKRLMKMNSSTILLASELSLNRLTMT
jgi:hypothetical protein